MVEAWMKPSKGIWGTRKGPPSACTAALPGPKVKKVKSWNTFKLFADSDRDGVPNVFDCRPRNPRKQGIVMRKVRLQRTPEDYLTTRGPETQAKTYSVVRMKATPILEKKGKVMTLREQHHEGLRGAVENIKGDVTIEKDGMRSEFYEKPLYTAGTFGDLFKEGKKVVIRNPHRHEFHGQQVYSDSKGNVFSYSKDRMKRIYHEPSIKTQKMAVRRLQKVSPRKIR